MIRVMPDLTKPDLGCSRREALGIVGIAGTASVFSAGTAGLADPPQPPTSTPWRYCLNTSTIRGQELTALEEIKITGQAGYDGIEPWLGKLQQHLNGGGSIKELNNAIQDQGLTIESAIGFAPWIVNDPAKRKRGLEQAKKDMELLAQIGGKRIAAPPAGVARGETIDPMAAAERYRQLLELGEQTGVVPQIEMWGGHPVIGRVSTAIFIALECGHPDACFLGDVYHTYKGGSDFDCFRLLSAQANQVFHFNDYPADPPQNAIRDEHRVWPGDGIAPLSEILKIFRSVGASPVLSLELFNREYWNLDALEAARVGREKMRECVARAKI